MSSYASSYFNVYACVYVYILIWLQTSARFAKLSHSTLGSLAGELRDVATVSSRHHAVVESETRKGLWWFYYDIMLVLMLRLATLYVYYLYNSHSLSWFPCMV